MAVTSNWCRCTSCHAGYGWKDASFDFSDPSGIDCLVCHDRTGDYAKTPTACGMEKPGLDLVKVAQSVGLPTRANCGACHFYGGGGDGVKHGDLDSTMKAPPGSHDVHMGGQDFTCQDCHQTTRHKIAGSSTTCSVSEGRVACTDCHDERPHAEDHPLLRKLNDHGKSIACQTCHIPTFAKARPTLMFWDWSNAGKEGLKLPRDPYFISAYDKKRGILIKRQNVRPAYAWYNGRHRRYLAGDPLILKGVNYLNKPCGDISDPEARITPFKLHTALQPADASYATLVVPKLWGGFWKHYDWQRAARDGMREAGLRFSGKLTFVKTVLYRRLNHEVVPRQRALSCTHCHSPEGVMDFKALGYKGDPARTGGRFAKRSSGGSS